MTAELVRGQNHPLPSNRLEIRVSAGTPLVAAITLGDEQGRVVPGQGWLAHPGAPQLPGIEVPRQAAAEHRLAVDLGAMPRLVHRVHVLLALPTGRPGSPADFGATPAPSLAVTTPEGTGIAGYRLTGLGPETALLAVELYRRAGAWKVRAVGQGYAGGLPALLLDQGVPEAHGVAGEIHRAVEQEQARSISLPTPAEAATATLPGVSAAPQTSAGTAGGPSGGLASAAATQGQHGLSGAPGAVEDTLPGHPGPAPAPPGGPVDYRHPRRRTAPAAGQPASGPSPVGAEQPAPAAPAGPPSTGGPTGAPTGPVAGDATGWTMEERLHNQIWGMFEDLTRTVAAYRSAEDFAESRYEQELDRLLADPRTRGGPAADAAREEAMAKRVALVDQARAVLDRDLAQLTAEAEVVEPALPSAFAGWDNPVWHGYRPPAERPMAVRLGSLSVPEAPELRIPMLVRVPLERGLWIDAAEDRRAAVETAVAVAARLLASYPAGGFAVHTLDPAGSAAAQLAPLYAAGGSVVPTPSAGVAGVAEVLKRLTDRVDLIQMALRGGGPDALPPDFDLSEQLLIVHEFPYGFDDRAINQLRYLADEGPVAGVHLMLVADREEASVYGPVLDTLWRSLLRLTPLPCDHLADPWVGHAWTYEPALVPPGSQVLSQVLRQVAAAHPG